MSEFTLGALGLADRASADLAPELVHRLAVTLGVPVPNGPLPITWHWIFFVPLESSDALGDDGHPRRPAGRLTDTYPRRMFAGGRITSHGGLVAGRPAVRTTALRSAEEKSGRTGSLLVVGVRHRYEQDGAVVLEEEQDLVYRTAGGVPTPLPPPEGVVPDAAWRATATPDRPLLFRYSAVTFNSHRIHYDEPYATAAEGYPALVVHGPLTATRLADLAAARLERPLRTFAFRAEAPLFVDQKVTYLGDPTDTGADLRAVRADGATAMSAMAT
ncbi:MAG: acyl-CoA dehydrogenase [Actinobacteria bacterium]|nr:acyl-CoA dehydrogenase [Actinomycetota bacterium]